MAKKIIKYVRTPFGKFVKGLFIVFNFAMLCWLFSYWGHIAPMIDGESGASAAGAAIGSFLGTGMILTVWVLGAIVLGIPVLLTKGDLHEYTPEELEAEKKEKSEKNKWSKPYVYGGIALVAIVLLSSAFSEPKPAKSFTQAKIEAPKDGEPAFVSTWHISESTSPMDDSPLVTMSVLGTQLEYSSWQKETPALAIRCKENSTDIILSVWKMINPERDSDFNEYAVARIRYDDDPVFSSRFDISTNNEAFFFRQPIAAAKKMFGKKTMIFEFQPYSMGTYRTTFNIEGLEEKIKPLREACGW